MGHESTNYYVPDVSNRGYWDTFLLTFMSLIPVFRESGHVSGSNRVPDTPFYRKWDKTRLSIMSHSLDFAEIGT